MRLMNKPICVSVMSCEKKLPKLKWEKLETEMKQRSLDNERDQAELICNWQMIDSESWNQTQYG